MHIENQNYIAFLVSDAKKCEDARNDHPQPAEDSFICGPKIWPQ
jgi:hypothetical protein